MKKGNIIFSTLFTIMLSFLIIFSGVNYSVNKNPSEVYIVYLDGVKIGSIKSKDKLYELIDKEQNSIKEKYKVDKVYPPNNLKVIKNITYDNTTQREEVIYSKIKDISGFTIKGYNVNITYKDNEKEPISISVLDETIVEESLNNYVKAIIGEKEFGNFMNNTQPELTDVGEIIESVWFDETIKIKEAFIESDNRIFTDSQMLTHYLLFGNSEQNLTYTIKSGETLDEVAYKNKLNVGELLIANPDIRGKNALISEGQVVNVTMIDPLLTLTYDKHVVYDEETAFKTIVVFDESKVSSFYSVTQVGEPGITRITKKTQFVNGEENQGGYISSYVEIKPAIDKVITRGSRTIGYSEFSSNDSWIWPTGTPYYISSGYGYRWGKVHEAIDIAGQRLGAPIYAANGGVVVGASYDGTSGNCVTIDHQNGYYTQYAHLSKMDVSEGQIVSQGQVIGRIGATGYATGVHLHFGVWIGGYPHRSGSYSIDPRILYR